MSYEMDGEIEAIRIDLGKTKCAKIRIYVYNNELNFLKIKNLLVEVNFKLEQDEIKNRFHLFTESEVSSLLEGLKNQKKIWIKIEKKEDQEFGFVGMIDKLIKEASEL